MVSISTSRVLRELSAADAATTATLRGRILEQIVGYIFSLFPGVRHFSNNSLNSARSSEVDVCFWNNRLRGSLDFMPQILIVECKNTADRVGSPDIRIFKDKLQGMDLDHGILVAANGITGDPANLTAAHDVVRMAFAADKIRIIVITRSEIESLTDTDDLIQLLQNKILLLTMQARTFQ